MLIIAFGIGETFKIIIIANAAFFPVALNTLDGVRNVPRQYRDVADIFQFGRWSLTRKVILPSALPFILTGFRLALSRCWMIVVAAELFGSSSGLGHMMDWARQMFRIDVVMMGDDRHGHDRLCPRPQLASRRTAILGLETSDNMSKAGLSSFCSGLFARINFRGLAVLVLLLGVWGIAAHGIGQNSITFASLGSVIHLGVTLATDGSLLSNYAASLERILKGFAISTGLGFVVGSLLGISKWGERILFPLITAMRQVPIFGLIPLLALWFGMGEGSKLILIALAAFYPVVLNTHEGLRNVPQSFREVAKLYRFDRLQTLRLVLIPSALPAIITGLKQALAFAWIAVVGAELFLATAPGMGNLLETGREQFRMDMVLLAIVLISTTGILMNYAVSLVERRVLRWRPAFSANR